jgi:hypothetical protein
VRCGHDGRSPVTGLATCRNHIDAGSSEQEPACCPGRQIRTRTSFEGYARRPGRRPAVGSGRARSESCCRIRRRRDSERDTKTTMPDCAYSCSSRRNPVWRIGVRFPPVGRDGRLVRRGGRGCCPPRPPLEAPEQPGFTAPLRNCELPPHSVPGLDPPGPTMTAKLRDATGRNCGHGTKMRGTNYGHRYRATGLGIAGAWITGPVSPGSDHACLQHIPTSPYDPKRDSSGIRGQWLSRVVTVCIVSAPAATPRRCHI